MAVLRLLCLCPLRREVGVIPPGLRWKGDDRLVPGIDPATPTFDRGPPSGLVIIGPHNQCAHAVQRRQRQQKPVRARHKDTAVTQQQAADPGFDLLAD